MPHGAIRAIAVAGHHGNADKTLCGQHRPRARRASKKRQQSSASGEKLPLF